MRLRETFKILYEKNKMFKEMQSLFKGHFHNTIRHLCKGSDLSSSKFSVQSGN